MRLPLFLATGRYGVADPDTCQGGGEVAGEIIFTFPTAAGEQSVRTPYTGTFGGLSRSPSKGLLAALITSRNWLAEGNVTPVRGDCVVGPLTRVRDIGEFIAC